MTFKPERKTTHPSGYVTLRMRDDDAARVKAAARASGVSMTEFMRQCILYALDNMEAP